VSALGVVALVLGIPLASGTDVAWHAALAPAGAAAPDAAEPEARR
jgi:hypothetical protein